MTVGSCGLWSWAVGGEDLGGGSAAHEVAVVVASVVVVDEPRVGFGADLLDRCERSAMERWSPAFFEHGAVEAFAHRVVVRAARRGPVVADLPSGERVGEPGGDPFGTVEFLTPVKPL